MRGHSVGGYGSVTTNKVIASLMGDLFGLHVQAYPKYGSVEEGFADDVLPYRRAVENLHALRARARRVHPAQRCQRAQSRGHPPRPGGQRHDLPEFVQGDAARDLDGRALWARRRIREKNATVMALDTFKIADEVATNPELRIRMMGVVLLGVFLKATPFAVRRQMSFEQLMEGIEKAVRSYWGKRGEQVVQDNLTCIRRATRT
jgi:pyruvate-ferredoxin/flavodoxin oxidoreductase